MLVTIHSFSELPSTQTYALEAIREQSLKLPFCIHALKQSAGIGSRGNTWDSITSALTFSFALEIESLPSDLRLESSSIFFGVIMQQYLRSLDSDVWLKYPNDLYIERNKIGGILTQKVKNALVCGIGINLGSDEQARYAALESNVSAQIETHSFLQAFFESFENFYSWKHIFSIYQLEFHKNDSFSFHHNGRRISLKDARLNGDGSISVGKDIFYSLR